MLPGSRLRVDGWYAQAGNRDFVGALCPQSGVTCPPNARIRGTHTFSAQLEGQCMASLTTLYLQVALARRARFCHGSGYFQRNGSFPK